MSVFADKMVRSLVFFSLFSFSAVAVADVDLPSKFSNLGSIVNTRHNLTQGPIGAGAMNMNPYRNNYGEVCVYCHTPHGANTNITAPLWNRTFNSQTYTVYNSTPLTATSSITSTINQPGVASLTCLSCHDGTLAMDSIINMPGSGNYGSSQSTSQGNTFLNTWNNASGPDASVHLALKPGECLACHDSGAGFVGAGATDFKIAAIGTDLTSTHPIGINLPTTRIGVDFNDPDVKGDALAFYDQDGNGKASSKEIRFYKTNSDYRVECASCHDPHGVKSAGEGSALNPTFLRKKNEASVLCTTCHAM